MQKVYTIDAEGKSLGRVASEVALLLQGKTVYPYTKDRMGDIHVEVRNVGKVRIDKKKLKTIHRRSHMGYPGSLHEVTLGRAFARNPGQVFRHAVSGMLPKNRLQAKMLKHLAVHI